MTTPAIIAAGLRTGGTFLSHALSNHPQIFCDRGEPLHRHSPWCELRVGHGHILRGLLTQEGYSASLCKLQYDQLYYEHVREVLLDMRARVIHLTRENKLRQAVSLMINNLARKGQVQHPQHSTEPVPLLRLSLDPDAVLDWCRDLEEQDRLAAKWLGDTGLPLLHVTYADLVGYEGREAREVPPETARKLCKFLGVRPQRLAAELRRVNAYPLPLILGNWDRVRAVIEESEFEYCLGDEE
jgi:hypothetical protein